MNTQQLIGELASDIRTRAASSPRLGPRLASATALASMVSLAAILLLLSRSPHFAHGPTATVMFTVLAGATLAVGAFWAMLNLSYPEGRIGALWLILPVAVLVAGLGLEIARTSASSWSARLWGSNPLACFLSVTALSLPILAATLATLRNGASTHPRLTGAVAGLLSGGITITLYTLHCPEDSLLFVASWHVLAVATVAGCGALAAERYLRW